MQMRNFIFLMFGDRKHHFIIIKYKKKIIKNNYSECIKTIKKLRTCNV